MPKGITWQDKQCQKLGGSRNADLTATDAWNASPAQATQTSLDTRAIVQQRARLLQKYEYTFGNRPTTNDLKKTFIHQSGISPQLPQQMLRLRKNYGL